ncbi:MAG: oligosaccharide flippase family protein [Nitrospira sp.]
MMSRLKANIVANFAGAGFVSTISLVVVPLYLGMLGAEAYGLIGFFLSFRSMAGMLDLGLSAVVSREVAARVASGSGHTRLGSLVRTIEVIYWGMGLVAGGAMFAWAAFASQDWLKLSELSSDTVMLSAYLFGITLMATWPVAFYRGLLRGLEQQVQYNFILSGTALLRAVGSVALLFFVQKSVLLFLLWQLLVGVVEVLIMGLTAWYYVNRAGVAQDRRFDFGEIQQIWGFMSGVSMVTLLGVAVSQIDRVIISKLLPLEMLGYYTVAYSLSVSLGRLSGPIVTAVFPRLSAYFAKGDAVALTNILRRSSSLVTLVVAPVGIGLAWFSYEVLLVWTQSVDAAVYGQSALALLAIGYVFNAMAHLDSNLQLAAGRTRLLLMYGAVSSLLYVPAVYLAIRQWGLAGAAGCWLALNMVSFVLLAILRTAYILKVPVSLNALFGNMHFVLISALLFALARLLSTFGNVGPMTTLAVAVCIGGGYLLWCLRRYQLAGFLQFPFSSRSDG